MQRRVKAELQVDEWLMSDFADSTRVEVLELLRDEKFDEINARLSGQSKLVFGTAGLRTRMGAGFDRMNCLTVLQTTQGLAAYLVDTGVVANAHVVIGFDARHNSESFAHVAAAVFASRNIKVHLIESPGPTPLNPFWIARTGAICGVQVTASHNPKQDNGYKLYWSNGAQIVPPVDAGVAAAIEKNRAVSQSVFKFLDPVTCRLTSTAYDSDLVTNVYSQVVDEYVNIIRTEVANNTVATNKASGVKFAYTAMHGVGFAVFMKLFQAFGFDPAVSLVAVAAQTQPDPEFPTVKFPNPEEKGALNLAIADAEKHDCNVVLANDPDADRFTCAERQADGKWYQFTGDELGLLFADWQMSHLETGKSGLLVNSVVSSRMVSELCRVRGFRFSDCLTGFKWIANESIRIRQADADLVHLLGYEEAIGYQLTAAVPDKDGVSAACAMAEFATNLYRQGSSLRNRIEEILRSEIGFFTTNNGYFIIDDPTVTAAVFSEFRASGMTQLGGLKIRSIRDVTNGVDTSLRDGEQSHLPATPDAEMITIFFENGAVVTVRASGTEPKVKFYSEMSSKISREQAKAELDKVVEIIKNDFYQPSKYAMKEQPSM